MIETYRTHDIAASPVARIVELLQGHSTRFLRYLAVGGSGVVVNMGLLYLFVAGAGLDSIFAAALATELSILWNFTLNDRWTFRDRRSGTGWAGRAIQYNGIALLGLVVSLAVMAVLTYGLGMHYLLANLLAISTSMFTNYALNLRITWSRRPKRAVRYLGPVPRSADRPILVPIDPR